MGSVRTSPCHGHVVVGVFTLVAKGLVELVLWLVRSKFGIHVPAHFLRTRHWVVELLLGQHVQGIELLLKDFELLFPIATFLFDERLHACWLVGDRDDCHVIQISKKA